MKETKENIKRVYHFSKGSRKYLIKFFILSIISCAIYILVPILNSKQLVNLTGSVFDELIEITVILFVVNMISNFIVYFNQKYTQIFFRETLKNLQIAIGKKILEIEVSSIDNHNTGVFTQRIANDTSSLSKIFAIGGRILINIITDLGVFVAVFLINKIFFIYYVVITLIFLYVQRRRVKKVGICDKEYRVQKEKTAGLIAELIRGIRDIKMLNAEDSFMDETSKNIDELTDSGYKMSIIDRKYQLIIASIKGINELLLVLLIIFFVKDYSLKISLGLVLYSYRQHIFNLVFNVGNLLDYVKDFNISSNRVFELFDSEEFSKENFGTKHLDNINGNFEFKNVTFAYKDKDVLKNMSFKINSGETVAFVGKSGAGKTTIFSLLCKLYKINNGVITIDDISINDLDKESIRGNITIISQNPYIFNMSIKDNLRIVKKDVTDDEIKEACKLACLDEFIDSLEDGYDTVVGESGVVLSGGQRQRLAIARALVQKTKIILFDEATSALDNITQAKIQEAINNLKHEYTILIIAHRLSTIKNVDRILYLNDGRIDMEGTHEELLSKCTHYKELYESEIDKNN